jgi:GxxExxY protein
VAGPSLDQPQRHGGTEMTLNELTEKIIGAAIAVHRELGPGLLEAVYEAALCIELDDLGLKYRRQLVIPVKYKHRPIGVHRLDLLVEDRVVVELKSVQRFEPVFEAIVLSYLRFTGRKVGLFLNFNSRFLRDGIRRFIL